MKVLITLGPTQESIDAVRYITNASSGKMGLALAQEALKRGYSLKIVSGPITEELPSAAKVIRVKTAEEMTSISLKELRDCDVFISTAAIADYSPVNPKKEKIRSGRPKLVIELAPTRKLTFEAREKYPELFIVGFKAETNIPKKELFDCAYSKLTRENLNLIAANDLSKNPLGSDYNEILLIGRDGKKEQHSKKTKKDIAGEIWDKIEKEYKKKR